MKYKQKFLIEHPDYLGEEADDRMPVEAWNAEDAAVVYAEIYNGDGDYPLVNESAEIVVHAADGGQSWRFRIGAEETITHFAREITGDVVDDGE